MNSYNENLRSTVVSTLQSLDLEYKKACSQVDAAAFTLHYANGATITAQQQLQALTRQLEEQSVQLQQTASADNAGTNVLNASTNADGYVKQAITNAAVAAANVQVAANSIVSLAADIGTMYAIVQAADAEGEIYKIAKEVYGHINATALEAEQASQLAMDVSVQAAEITSASLLQLSKTTHDLTEDLLKQISDQNDALAQYMADARKALAVAVMAEKNAEGAWMNGDVDAKAVAESYALINKGLNQDIAVSLVDCNTLTVSFQSIASPFEKQSPVKGYYIVFCKADKQTVFSISNAEQLVAIQASKQFVYAPDGSAGNKVTVTIPYPAVVGEDGQPYHLQDSDGNDIVQGVPYVVFVMTVLTDAYKKKLGSFEDRLLAASLPFTIVQTLKAAGAIEIKPADTPLKMVMPPKSFKEKEHKKQGAIYNMAFYVAAEVKSSVEYRCMFLPEAFVQAGRDFSLMIAERVTAANYIIADKFPTEEGSCFCFTSMGIATTDIFGNCFNPGQAYYPVVLSVSTEEETKRSGICNAVSAVEKVNRFIYQPSKPAHA